MIWAETTTRASLLWVVLGVGGKRWRIYGGTYVKISPSSLIVIAGIW